MLLKDSTTLFDPVSYEAINLSGLMSSHKSSEAYATNSGPLSLSFPAMQD